MVASSEAFSNIGTARPSLQIPLLTFSLQAQIDRQDFSFREQWRSASKLENNVRDWIEGIFIQFRAIEIALGRADVARLFMTGRADESAREVATRIFNFAESVSRDDVAIDRYGNAIVDMVQRSGRHLRATKDRIKDLEMEIDEILDHAKKWLQLLAKEIEGER